MRLASPRFDPERVYPVEALDLERVRRVVRLARGPSTLGQTFADYSSSPNFSAAWADIQGRMQLEGIDPGIINIAKTQFTDAYANLGQAAQDLNDSDIANAAKQLVLTGKTVAGAVNVVQGLISSGGNLALAPDAINGFTGTMLAIGASTGLVTGIAAGIVAGVTGLVVDALKGAGLFGGSAPAAGVTCGGFPFNTKPDWTVGCLGAWGPAIAPGSTYWRSFPQYHPQTFADADLPWFIPGQVGPGNWKGAFYGIRAQGADQSYSGVPNPPSTDWRPIDNAFGQYGLIPPLEQNITTQAPELAGLVAAFVAAWYANAEYALNGWQPKADSDVLAHTVRLWNAAHEANPYKLLAPDDRIDPWLDSLVQLILNQPPAGTDVVTALRKNVIVHLGPLKTPPDLLPSAGGAGAGAASSSSGVATAAVATGAVAVAGGGLWLLLGQPMTLTAFKSALDRLWSKIIP